MKRFEIITEADARVLDIGATVELAKGGARDAAREGHAAARRVTVVAAGAVGSGCRAIWRPSRRRPPRGHRQRPHGVGAEAALVSTCGAAGLAVDDVGTDGAIPVDYPDIAARWRGRSRAAKPTPASSSTAPASGRPSPPTRSAASARRCARRDDRALLARAQRRQRADARRDAPAGRRRHADRRRLARHADARGALHPAAAEDPPALEESF